MLPFKRILCPIDFSESSHTAMQAAVELATHFGSELWFMHVVVPVPVTVPGPEPLLIDVISTGSELEESAKESLEKMVAQFQLTGLKTRLTILKGNPVDEILRVAEDEVVDLILLTTHGRTRLDYFIFGSVAEKVMRLSPCPVLTVRNSSHTGEEKADEGVPSEKYALEDEEKGTSEDVPKRTANYLERLEGQLKEWEAAIGRLADTVEASTFKADVKTKYGHQIDDLKRRQQPGTPATKRQCGLTKTICVRRSTECRPPVDWASVSTASSCCLRTVRRSVTSCSSLTCGRRPEAAQGPEYGRARA
jgi:nucleotide-binding universal stress UspA family protein